MGDIITNQKEEELFYLKRFLAEENISFPNADIINIQAGEGPDFYLKTFDIGIEVTSYQQMDSPKGGSIRKQTESAWYNIIHDLKGKCSHLIITDLTVHLTIIRQNGVCIAPKGKLRDTFINDLIEMVSMKSTELKMNDPNVVNNKEINSFSKCLSKFIREINIYPPGINGKIHWHFGNLHGGVAGFSDLELDIIIKTKKKKLLIYNKLKCDKLWLLIYSTNESPASTGSFVKDQVEMLAERNIDLLSNSGFDKVWYYNSFDEPFACKLYPI